MNDPGFTGHLCQFESSNQIQTLTFNDIRFAKRMRCALVSAKSNSLFLCFAVLGHQLLVLLIHGQYFKMSDKVQVKSSLEEGKKMEYTLVEVFKLKEEAKVLELEVKLLKGTFNICDSPICTEDD